MDIAMIIDYLKQYNEDELFYKEYFIASKNSETLNTFLSQFDKNEIRRRHLLVKELVPEVIPHHMEDDEYFDVLDNTSVYLSKHNRYTPTFLHAHVFFEMVYVFEGTCEMTVSDSFISLPEGGLCLIAPSVLHTISVFDDSIIINILLRRSTFDDIMFNVLRTNSIISNFFMDNLYAKKHIPYIIFNLCGDEPLKTQLLDMYLEQFGNDRYSNYIISSMMVIFFAHLNRKHGKTALLPDKIKFHSKELLDILSYIQDHYSSCTLQQVAENYNYSVAYCSKLIKSYTGHTYSELITTIKMRKAESMLSSTHMTVETISDSLGYKNVETFFRTFKKHFNITPARYRQTHL